VPLRAALPAAEETVQKLIHWLTPAHRALHLVHECCRNVGRNTGRQLERCVVLVCKIVERIIDILERSAVTLPGYGAEEAGAERLDVAAAVELAQDYPDGPALSLGTPSPAYAAGLHPGADDTISLDGFGYFGGIGDFPLSSHQLHCGFAVVFNQHFIGKDIMVLMRTGEIRLVFSNNAYFYTLCNCSSHSVKLMVRI
jgi:hypothetical protein